MKWLQLGILAEIVDRAGIVRKTAGTSIAGRFEFANRIKRLAELLEAADPTKQWDDLYHEQAEFAHVVDRLMELNSLQTDWFTPAQIEQLIFNSMGENGKPEPGWLVKINTSKKGDDADADISDPATLEQVIAGMSEDLKAAVELCTELPFDVAIGIAEARREQQLTPEEREEAKRAKNLSKMKKNSKMLDILDKLTLED
jgi:hypothetical protein